jgi:glycosyl transferase family 87
VPKSRRLVRLFITGMVCLHFLFFFKLLPRIERGYPDFIAFYTAGGALRCGSGHELYDQGVQYEAQKRCAGFSLPRQGALPYIHPPFEALIFLPVTLLPYLQAFMLWDLLGLAGLFYVACLLRRSVGALRSIPAWEFVLGSLAFFPVFACLLQGQDSILLLLLCTLGFNALKRESHFLAGCWFALGAFKFQWVLPMVLLIAIWKMRRVATGFFAVSLVLGLVSLGLAGWQNMLFYPTYVLHVVKSPSLGGVTSNLMPNLRGLILGWPWPFSRAIGNAAVVLASVALFLSAATRGSGGSKPQRLELQFSLAVIVSGLIGWHSNAHDLSLLILPLVLLADYGLNRRAQEAGSGFALLFPALPLLISPLWIVLWLYAGQVNLIAIPLLWWAWRIGKELSRDLHSAGGAQPSASGLTTEGVSP